MVTEHSSRFLTDSIPENQKKWATEIFKASSLNLSVSDSLKETLEKTFHLPFDFLPNMTDTSLFSPRKKSTTPQFLSVGNLTKNKNQALAIESFGIWVKKNNAGRLVIVGSGSEERALKKLTEKEGLNNHVEFTGQIPRESLTELMGSSTCLLICSLHETFGVVAIEALSSGIPVISTRCGGTESIIQDNVHGYFTDFSATSLFEKMNQVWQHREHFPSEKLHEYAEREFSRQAIAQKLETIYHEILQTTDVKKS